MISGMWMTYKPCDQNKKQTAASLHYGVLSYQESLDFSLPPPLLSICVMFAKRALVSCTLEASLQHNFIFLLHFHWHSISIVKLFFKLQNIIVKTYPKINSYLKCSLIVEKNLENKGEGHGNYLLLGCSAANFKPLAKPEAHGELCTEVGFLNPAKHLVGFELGTLQLVLNVLAFSPYLSLHVITTTKIEN